MNAERLLFRHRRGWWHAWAKRTARAAGAGGLLAVLVVAAPAAAQWRPEPVFPAPLPAAVPPPRPWVEPLPEPTQPAVLTAVGALAAVAGSVGGASLGYWLDREHFHFYGGDDPGSVGALAGWFAGAALTTPVMVHRANRRSGSLRSALVSSGLIAVAGFAGIAAVGSPGGVFFLLGAPLAQAISAVVVETRTSP